MPAEDEDEEETLGQRLRRLKTKEALDDAIQDVAPKGGERPESSFTLDVMGQFGGLEVKNPDVKPDAPSTAPEKSGEEEEETLGQRRARLQREREASGEPPAARPPMRTSQSMANLLSHNPVGTRQISMEAQAAQGTLLHQSQQHQMKQKMNLMNSNVRASSYNLDRPLVDAQTPNTGAEVGGLLAQESSRPANGLFNGSHYTAAANTSAPLAAQQRQTSFGGLLGQERSRPANGLFAGGAYPPPGLATQSPALPPVFGASATNPYFASPTAGLMNYNAYGNPGFPQMPPAPTPMRHHSAYMALNGGRVSMMPVATPAAIGPGFAVPPPAPHAAAMPLGYPNPAMNMMPMPMGMAMGELPLDPNQRDAIDRWRMGIA
jgi:hypothetical protein